MLKLDAAINAMEPPLSPEQAGAVREALRLHLRTDPGWSEVREQLRDVLRRRGRSSE